MKREPSEERQLLNEADFELRPLRLEDCDRVLAWRNQDHIRNSMFDNSILKLENHQKWIQKVVSHDNVESQFFICEYKGQPVGFLGLTHIDREKSQADWTFYIGESATPRGAGTVMCRLGMAYLFETMGLNRLEAQVIDFNTSSMALHRRLGFSEEGLELEPFMRDGQAYDVFRFGISKEAWDQQGDVVPCDTHD